MTKKQIVAGKYIRVTGKDNKEYLVEPKVSKKEMEREGEKIIVENIVQANPTYHKTQPQTLYKTFREVLTLETLMRWQEGDK